MEELAQLATAAVILNQYQQHSRQPTENIPRSLSFPAKTLYPDDDVKHLSANEEKDPNDCGGDIKEAAVSTCHPAPEDLEYGTADPLHCSAQKPGLKLRSVGALESIDRSSSYKHVDHEEQIINGFRFKPRYDGRLHPDYPLYCEGMPKPAMRGVVHLITALILPFGVYHLWNEANGNPLGRVAGTVFVLGNLYCIGMSALFHVGNWSKETEIVLQKLDHCGIPVYAASVNFPCSLMLMPGSSGTALLLISVVSCAWTCFHIMNNRPAVWRFVIVSMSIIVYFPVLFFVMSSFEFSCGCLNTIIQGIGMAVFVAQKPDPLPKIFGYHEIFHLICVIGMVVTYMCNWSIIRRTCNPYEIHTDVLDLMQQMLS